MGSRDNYEVAEFFRTPELLISQSKNEDFGDPDTTTLLPLDHTTLEVICRVNLPGVPITGSKVDNWFAYQGFNQLLTLHTGADFGPLGVQIIQCSSHVDALKAMGRSRFDVKHPWAHGKRRKRLGNHAFKIEHCDGYEHWIKIIWVRWTTVVEIMTKGATGDEDYEEQQLVDVKRLASALDTAMKEHKGTISQVPKVTVGLKQSDISLFREEGQTESIRMTFQPETHAWRRFWVEEVHSSDAAFEVAYGSTDSRACTCGKELLTWESCSDYGHFPESGIFLRCKELGHAALIIRLAHKSSLWPTQKTFTLS